MKNCPGCERKIDRYSIACQYCGRVEEERQKRKSDSLRAGKSITLSISIDCKSRKVYRFVSSLVNLPKWAPAFCLSIKKSKKNWIAQTTQGQVQIRMEQKNNLGVLDHYITLSKGKEALVPMRVVERGAASEVTFTLFQLPGMPEEDFERDIKLVGQDLKSLKRILEKN